jgi:hypothetical protein
MDKMRRRTPWTACLFSLATLGMLAPQPVHAAQGAVATQQAAKTEADEPVIVDVGLHAAGQLTGQVVGPNGRAMAGETIYVLRGATTVATCRTNEAGCFAVPGLSGGIYEVRCQQGVLTCRLWAPQTAPPSAKSGLLLTTGDSVVRGQTSFFSRRGSWLKGPAPWIIAGVVAVAVPVALTVRHHGSSS